MGYHIDELKHRFGVALPSEKFIKVSPTLQPNASPSRPLTGSPRQFLLGMQIMWCFNLTLTKAAILALYIKIFTMRSFVIAAKATMVLAICWYVPC